MSKPELIRIQDPVSDYRTVRTRLSNDATAKGHEAFLIEGVPFSKYQSRYYAELVAKLIVEKVKQTTLPETEPLSIYEFGAGSGLLARSILDYLKAYHPKVYARVKLTISDICEDSFYDMVNSNMFHRHQANVQLEVGDFLATDFFKSDPPFFIYCTYLYDALPMNRIVLDQGKAYEILTETYLPKVAQFIDTSSAIPQVIGVDQLTNLTESSENERRWLLRRDLGRQLLENYSHRPVEASDIPDEVKTEIINFAAQHPDWLATAFSVPSLFFLLMKRLSSIPNLTFFSVEVIVDDDQFCRKLALGRSNIHYGVVTYHSLFWPFAEAIFSDLNLHATRTVRENGKTAEFLLETGKPKLARAFHRLFDQGHDGAVATLKAVSLLKPTAKARSEFLTLHRTVPRSQKLEFTFLINMIALAVKLKAFDLAVYYAKLLRRFSPTLCPATYGTFASIARLKGNNRREHYWFREGVKRFPQNCFLRTHLVNYYLKTNQVSRAVSHSQALIRLSERDAIPTLMLQVALLYMRDHQPKPARAWVDAILEMKAQLHQPLESDLDIFRKAEHLAQKL